MYLKPLMYLELYLGQKLLSGAQNCIGYWSFLETGVDEYLSVMHWTCLSFLILYLIYYNNIFLNII
jgi:hypothetical protein